MATIGARRFATHGAVFAAATIAATLILCLGSAGSAYAEEPPAKPEESAEFKPPPGFRPKKRGDVVLYCRREAVLGTRFQAEKCYDQAGIRALRLADLEKTQMLERIRACGTSSCPVN